MRSITFIFAVATISASGMPLYAQGLQNCPSQICTESVTTLDLEIIPGQVVAYTDVTVDYYTAAYYQVCADIAIFKMDSSAPNGYDVVSPSTGGYCQPLGNAFTSVSNNTTVLAYPGEYSAASPAWLMVYYPYDMFYPYPYCLPECGDWADLLGYSLVATSDPGVGSDVEYIYTFPAVIQFLAYYFQRVDANGSSAFKSVAMPSIVLTSNGTNLATDGSGVALLDPSPALPQLQATLSPTPSATLSVTWHMQLSWSRSTGDSKNVINCNPYRVAPYPTVPWVDSPSITGSATQVASAAYNISQAIGTVRGGNAEIWFDLGKQTSSHVTFQILGQNPTESSLRASLASGPWYITMIARAESGFRQFNPQPSYTPNWGNPCGFGIMQNDPPSGPGSVWNWQTNVSQGVSTANTYLTAAHAAWQTYVSNYVHDTILTTILAPCTFQVGQHCTFVYPDPPAVNQAGSMFTASWGDANGIRRYNTGSYDLLRYQKTVGATLGTWIYAAYPYDRYAANGKLISSAWAYVGAVCSSQP